MTDYYRRRDEYRREDYRRQDHIDHMNRLDDIDYQQKVAAREHELFLEAVKNEDTLGAIRHGGGVDLAIDYANEMRDVDADRDSRRAMDDHMAKARKAMDAGKFQSALTELEMALIESPGHAAILFQKGRALFCLGRFKPAIRDFDKSLKGCPADRQIQVRFWRGRAHQKAGHGDSAEGDFNFVLEREKKHKQAYFWRAVNRMDRGKWAAAVADFTLDLMVNPGDSNSLHRRGVCWHRMGKPQLALKDYADAEKKLGDNAMLENDRGLAYSALDNLIEAYRAFSRAIQHNDRKAVYYSNRAYVSLRHGRIDDAFKDYTQELKLNPKSWHAHEGRARCLERQQTHDRAVQELSEAIKLNPKRASLFFDRAYNRFRLARYPRALEDCTEAIRLQPEYPQVYLLRARIQGENPKEHASALRDFDEAIRLRENLPFAHVHRARLRFRTGDRKGALADLNREVQIFPESGWALMERGRFLANQKDRIEARRDFVAARDLFRKSGDKEGETAAEDSLK